MKFLQFQKAKLWWESHERVIVKRYSISKSDFKERLPERTDHLLQNEAENLLNILLRNLCL